MAEIYDVKWWLNTLTPLYPKTENISREDIGFSSDDGVIVRVRFVDLFDIKGFIENFAV